MTSPLEFLRAFALRFLSYSAFGICPVLAIGKSNGVTPASLILLLSILDGLGVLMGLNLTRAANQSRSHPPMSVTWNLVSERARRIPERVLKIHEQSALAMKFTCGAVTEIVARAAKTLMPPLYFIQHVGVARNFDLQIVMSGEAGHKIF